jgi:predicted lipoprotein with Yx(FWY)xxD motif
MKRLWMLAGVCLLTAALAVGAIACGDDDEDDDGNGGEPTSVETMADETPMDETPMEGETPDGGEPTTDGGGQGGFTTFVVTEDDTLGPILTTFDGYTVYTFDNDNEGTSNCTDACASTWPPMPAQGEPTGGEGVTGQLGTITRADGTSQATYNDQPLYMYSGDASPGDTNGDGSGGVWHVVTIE